MARKESIARLYQQFMRLSDSWPVDSARKGRDLGEHIKTSWTEKFKSNHVEEQEAQKALDALMKISTNYYRDKFQRRVDTSFTGDASKSRSWILSNDGQSYMTDNSLTFWQKLRGKKS